ncbi:MAG: ArsR/SmtB family transcription factor [Candidatus Hodarchaeales archaeon]
MSSKQKVDFENISEDQPEQLEDILEVFSNHLRRNIIQCLAREDNYMAALAEEVKSTPQALVKHLKILEKKQIIRSQIASPDDLQDEDDAKDKFTVRAEKKEDKKIKYYTLNKSINLRINFGLGYYEISGNQWFTDEMKEEQENVRERYKELLDEFANVEKYIQSQLDNSTSVEDSLNQMNELLGKFGDLEKFLIVERQLILVRKLKQAVKLLSGDQTEDLRPLFFELLHILDIKDDKFKAFEQRVRELLPEPKAEQTIKLLDRSRE